MAVMMIELLSVMMVNGIIDLSVNAERVMEWALWGIHPVEKLNVGEWRKKWRELVG
jgi:hypothetical protein